MEASNHRPTPNPFLPLNSSCAKGARFFCQSSVLPSCACKGLYMRCSPNRSAISQITNNFSSNSFLCISRKYDKYWRSVSKKELGILHYDWKLDNHNRYSRSIVVRSELAQTGSPGAAYPLSELQLVPKIRAMCFYAITALAAVFLFVLMVLAHPFVLLLDRSCRKVHHLVAKIWASLTITPFYKVEFEGLENLPAGDTPAVYVSNHQSFLDIYTLLTLGRSFKFISKTAIFLFPVVGWAMFLMGAIPLKRLDSKSQLDCLKRCMDLIKKGASVFFFPEGTRSKDGNLGAFKKGAFSVAAKTGVPVVPITLLGTGKIMPAGMEGILCPGSVKVVIHKPIKGTNADMLCNEARRTIAEVLNQKS